MYYLFKSNPWGNKVPCFAAQSDKIAMAYTMDSKDDIYGFHAHGNQKTIMGL